MSLANYLKEQLKQHKPFTRHNNNLHRLDNRTVRVKSVQTEQSNTDQHENQTETCSKIEKRSFSICLELFSGVLVGFVIGYFGDRYFHTGPYLLVSFLVTGFLAGMLNIYRYMVK